MDARERDLDSLREAARACKACPLWKNGTRDVIGAGAPDARILLVGEKPGLDDQEGRLLDQAIEAAGVRREDVYVTHLVKHLKPDKPPNPREIRACWPWLEREIELIRPDVLVGLGAVAARALLARTRRAEVVATLNPAAILQPSTAEARVRDVERLSEDLRLAARLVREKSHP